MAINPQTEPVEARAIGAGDEALLVYPAGDCDQVTILSLTPTVATVRLPDGRTYRTVPEDIGIGVDDELKPRYDRFAESVYGMSRDEWNRYGLTR